MRRTVTERLIQVLTAQAEEHRAKARELDAEIARLREGRRRGPAEAKPEGETPE